MKAYDAELYAVANMKHGEITHLVAGPFVDEDAADQAMEDLDGKRDLGGACYYEVVKTVLAFGPKWS